MLRLFNKYLISASLLLSASCIVFRIILRQDYLHNRRVSFIPLMLELLVCGLYCNFPYLYLPFDWPELPTLPDSAARRILSLISITVGLTITLIGIASLGFLR